MLCGQTSEFVSMLCKPEQISCGHKIFLRKIRNIFCVSDRNFVSAKNFARDQTGHWYWTGRIGNEPLPGGRGRGEGPFSVLNNIFLIIFSLERQKKYTKMYGKFKTTERFQAQPQSSFKIGEVKTFASYVYFTIHKLSRIQFLKKNICHRIPIHTL